jgi:hypothetical protein
VTSKTRLAIVAFAGPLALACGGTTTSAPPEASVESSSAPPEASVESSLGPQDASAESSGPSDASAESSPAGDSGCLTQEPAVNASCTLNQSVCEQGDLCCIGYEWTCFGGRWSKVALGCVCRVDAGNDSGQSDTGLFMCGTGACDPQQQYCEYDYSNVDADAGPSIGCESFEAGCTTASCACIGASLSATAPGGCGCYQSSSGAVSYTFCPP